MDKLKKFSSDLETYSLFWLFMGNCLGIGVFLITHNVLNLSIIVSVLISTLIAFFVAMGTAKLIVLASTQPLKAIWQAIWHISPNGANVNAPNPSALTHGRELATTLVHQVYELAGGVTAITENTDSVTQPVPDPISVPINLADHLPLPVIGLDKDGKVTLLNKQAAAYLGQAAEECINKQFNDIAHLSFQDNNTLESWIATSKAGAATATSSWDRVRLQLPDNQGIKQLDLIARYSKDDQSGQEIMLALFDHSDKYATEDNSTSYVALAVHELRTPLTVLRGYIEVFEDELDGKLTPELQDFMRKMRTSAQTLTAFVSNILNVARVDENQMNLSLHEANWNELLPEIVQDLELRAKVRGKTISLNIAPGLPTVAVDKISMYEVLSNLVENSIKYSSDGSNITVYANLKDDTIETVVEDHGAGIPQSAIDHLYTKFYRSHRSKNRVGGSGLGLYLVKAIITAHGGQVWVQSHEGEGSKFGFTLQQYSKMSSEQKDATGSNIEREAHGWIKNHSMYRK